MKKAGTNYKALCPFHQEKSPSFVISPTKNLAYCFGCHHGGGPIKFLMEIEKIEYREALQILAKEAGVELKTDYYKERWERTGDVYDMYRIATEFYHEELLKEENKEKLDYLIGRSILPSTIERFNLGYSSNPRDLFAKLKDKWFSDQNIIDSGIFVWPGRDKFYGRIIFPIANFTGHTVAFTGRIIGQGEPKYLNSPASDIFNKSAILYGFHLAKTTVAKEHSIIIVEGQMDTVSLHQAGITNTVGISGTALTKEHIGLIKRLTKKLYLCLDGDKAGIEATFTSLENLHNEDLDVYIISLEEGKDPDEFLKSGWDFRDAVKKALSPVQFYIKEGRKKYDITEMTGKKAIWEELKKMLKRIRDPIEVDAHIREIGKILNLSTDILYGELKNFREKRVIEESKKWTGFEISELIAGYIHTYWLFDLFLEKFQYTLEDGMQIPSFFVVKNLIELRDTFWQDSTVDQDRFAAIELFIEEENSTLSKDMVMAKFLDLVSYINKVCFEQEKKATLANLDPSSTEYLIQYRMLQEKGQKIGVKVNRG